jgi:hypothetical protein
VNQKLNRILNYIDQYYIGKLEIGNLEQNISLHINDFDSVEERQIYNLIRDLDANIEAISYTIPKEKQIDSVKKYMEYFKTQVPR